MQFGPQGEGLSHPIPSAYKSHFSFADKEGERRDGSAKLKAIFGRRAKLGSVLWYSYLLRVPHMTSMIHDTALHRTLKNGTRRLPPRALLHGITGQDVQAAAGL